LSRPAPAERYVHHMGRCAGLSSEPVVLSLPTWTASDRRGAGRALPEQYRDQLAVAVLPYCHARIAPTARPQRVQDLSDAELSARIRDALPLRPLPR
jgi:hypothetical protein